MQSGVLLTGPAHALMVLDAGLSHGPSFRTASASFKTMRVISQPQVVWREGEVVGRKGNFPLHELPLRILELPSRAGV